MVRRDRHSAGGGRIVHLKEGIAYKHRTDLEGLCHDSTEAVWL